MSSARPQMFAAIAAATVIASAATKPAAASPDTRITSLVAGAREMYALRGNMVVTFDASGREIGRCARFAPPPPERPAPLAAGTIDADEALRLAGLPDDDLETPEAEDALDDEGLGPRRRTRTAPDTAIVARALAASAADDDAWIATSAGLYRWHERTCTRVALPGRDAIAVAAAGDAVAVASEQLLWRSDGGGGFRVAAGMVARPRVLAVVDGAHTLVATDDAVVEIGPHGVTRPVLDRGGDALAVCGGVAMAFAGDGVWTWIADEPPRRVGDRPLARTLACGGGRDAGFLAAGGGLYTSVDGAVWRERSAAPGRPVTAAAVIADRIWLAVDDQVIAMRDAFPAPAGPVRPLPALPALPPLATGGLVGSTIPWPQLTLVFAGQRTPLRSGWSLVVLVAFRFGRAATAGADRHQLAADLLRRDAALAAEELELSIPTDDDPSRAARLRAVRQEREALR